MRSLFLLRLIIVVLRIDYSRTLVLLIEVRGYLFSSSVGGLYLGLSSYFSGCRCRPYGFHGENGGSEG